MKAYRQNPPPNAQTIKLKICNPRLLTIVPHGMQRLPRLIVRVSHARNKKDRATFFRLAWAADVRMSALAGRLGEAEAAQRWLRVHGAVCHLDRRYMPDRLRVGR